MCKKYLLLAGSIAVLERLARGEWRGIMPPLLIMKRTHILLITLLTLAGCASPRPPDQGQAFFSVAFSPDQSLFAFADGVEISVIDAETRIPINTLRDQPQDTDGGRVMSYRRGVGDTMVFLDNKRIATTGMGGLVSIWDVHSGRRLSVIDASSASVFASTIDFSPSANRLVIGTGTGELLLTSLDGEVADPLISVATLEGSILDLQFGQDGRYFASASLQKAAAQADIWSDYEDEISRDFDSWNVIIWDAQLLEKVGDLQGAREVLEMALVPGERALLTAGDELLIWKFLTSEQVGEVTGPSMALQNIGAGSIVAVSMVGMAAAAAVGSPWLGAELMASMPVLSTPRPEACVRSVAISPDGQTIVSITKGPFRNVMAVIDRASDKVVDKWTTDAGVCDMEFSPDGKTLLAATSTGIDIYDTADWKKTRLLF